MFSCNTRGNDSRLGIEFRSHTTTFRMPDVQKIPFPHGLCLPLAKVLFLLRQKGARSEQQRPRRASAGHVIPSSRRTAPRQLWGHRRRPRVAPHGTCQVRRAGKEGVLAWCGRTCGPPAGAAPRHRVLSLSGHPAPPNPENHHRGSEGVTDSASPAGPKNLQTHRHLHLRPSQDAAFWARHPPCCWEPSSNKVLTQAA